MRQVNPIGRICGVFQQLLTFETKEGGRTGDATHAILSEACVRAKAACTILARNDIMYIARLELFSVFEPVEFRLRHANDLKITRKIDI